MFHLKEREKIITNVELIKNIELNKFEKKQELSDDQIIEQQKLKMHNWVKQNKQTIEACMHRSFSETQEFMEKLMNMYDDLSVYALFPHQKLDSNDLYSSSICIKTVDYFPEEELNGLKKEYGKVKASDKLGRPFSIDHAFFSTNGLIIDPTMGQFLNLDSALQQHSTLFEGRIFIGTPKEAESIFGIEYMHTSK